MGLVGQGARAAVGLKGTKALPSNAPDQQSEFSAAYLLFSFMIGFIAGILAGLAIGLDTLAHPDFKVLIGIAAAGYAGADFIENSLSIIIPAGGKTSDAQQSAGTKLALDAHARAVGGHVDRLVASVAAIGARLGGAAAAPTPAAAPPPADVSARLTAAFKSCAPQVHADIWVPVLVDAFTKYDFSTNKRMAAAMGQFLVEAGSAFQEVRESMNYSTAAHIHDTFPHEFPTIASAEPYVHNQVGLGNRAYANYGGNGNEASGDGFRFRGGGLAQLTGRNDYAAFGAVVGMTVDQAVQYCATPEGAAISGCWYLATHGCLPLADAWALSKITRQVNGAAMLQNSDRIAYANSFLHALGG